MLPIIQPTSPDEGCVTSQITVNIFTLYDIELMHFISICVVNVQIFKGLFSI